MNDYDDAIEQPSRRPAGADFNLAMDRATFEAIRFRYPFRVRRLLRDLAWMERQVNRHNKRQRRLK